MTLIELMIGMTIGMLLVLSLLALLANTSSNGQNLIRSSEQIENGRYAAEMIQEELQLAGFVGEMPLMGLSYEPASPDPFTTPDPCSTDPTGAFHYTLGGSPELMVPAAIQGYAAAEELDCLENRIADTDAIVIRRLSTSATDVATLDEDNPHFYTQYSFCTTDPTVKLVFAQDPATLTLKNRACSAANTARAYVSRVYFVASCNVCGDDDTPSDQKPTLKRLDLINGQLVETALVEGIESLRFEYGFDTDGDGNVDVYQSTIGDVASATGSWGNVVAVKAYFITRSLDKALGSGLSNAQTFQFGDLDPITTTADGHVRHGYSTVIRLINPSGTREGA